MLADTNIVRRCVYDLTEVMYQMLSSIMSFSMERYMYATCGMLGSEAGSVGN